MNVYSTYLTKVSKQLWSIFKCYAYDFLNFSLDDKNEYHRVVVMWCFPQTLRCVWAAVNERRNTEAWGGWAARQTGEQCGEMRCGVVWCRVEANTHPLLQDSISWWSFNNNNNNTTSAIDDPKGR